MMKNDNIQRNNWKTVIKHAASNLYFAMMPTDAGMTNGMLFFHDFH